MPLFHVHVFSLTYRKVKIRGIVQRLNKNHFYKQENKRANNKIIHKATGRSKQHNSDVKAWKNNYLYQCLKCMRAGTKHRSEEVHMCIVRQDHNCGESWITTHPIPALHLPNLSRQQNLKKGFPMWPQRTGKLGQLRSSNRIH